MTRRTPPPSRRPGLLPGGGTACPAAVDLRKIDQHGATIKSLIPALFCRPCRPHPPFARLIELMLNHRSDGFMTIADDLLRIEDEAGAALSRLRDTKLQASLTAIGDISEQAKRAWSGSNIGYHAAVYFAGLQPAPPGVQFSPEWGLEDIWPTHQPHPGWQIMDGEAVRSELISRAGNPDTKAIGETLGSLRETFSALKERAISLLMSVAADDRWDGFIDRKSTQIESLINASDATIVIDLLPKGQYWSRDSLAMSQGLRVAPHQRLIALGLSATVLENGLNTLESTTRQAASHLTRLGTRQKKAELIGTNVFIGHGRSAAWRTLKDFIEDRLRLPVDEFNSVPVAGITTTSRLSELLDAAAFAFLVMTGEDELADGSIRARENVVHEVGLFQGRLGFSRAIILLEDGCARNSQTSTG